MYPKLEEISNLEINESKDEFQLQNTSIPIGPGKNKFRRQNDILSMHFLQPHFSLHTFHGRDIIQVAVALTVANTYKHCGILKLKRVVIWNACLRVCIINS
jgi:hypothetical protein